MIFSELYGAYYNAVAEILKHAVDHPLEKNELRRIVEKYAFGESILNVEPSLTGEKWQLLRPDGTTPLQSPPSMPLTLIQKRWLASLASDPRIRLFVEKPLNFGDVPPLFTPEDICIFDRYADGDDYADPAYQRNFRLILNAIRNQYPLRIATVNRRGNITHMDVLPKYLEYSEKDDKFRLFCLGHHFRGTVNLGRITCCTRCTRNYRKSFSQGMPPEPGSVTFELTDERNALERVLLHFAHFEKQAEQTGKRRFRVTIRYAKEDETELVIRILSFGPMIRVTAPSYFVNLIRERLIRQKNCGL